jgi:hypothetical protein
MSIRPRHPNLKYINDMIIEDDLELMMYEGAAKRGK